MCIRDRLRPAAVVALLRDIGPVGIKLGQLLATRSDLFSRSWICLLYTSDAADERSSVDLGGRRIIKKKKEKKVGGMGQMEERRGTKWETQATIDRERHNEECDDW